MFLCPIAIVSMAEQMITWFDLKHSISQQRIAPMSAC